MLGFLPRNVSPKTREGVWDSRRLGPSAHATEQGEASGRFNVAAALRAALPTRGRESGTRGGLNGQDTRWNKARRLDVATLLRLLEPRSEDGEAGPHASVRNRVHGRVTGPFPSP